MSDQKDHFLRSTRTDPGPRDWILDLFGSFVREFGGWVAVADLLALLECLGVTNPSARSALSRMKSQGELVAESRGSSRGYTLSPAAEEWFADGTNRIMNASVMGPDGEWVLAAFTVPESDRSMRYRIRTRLQDLGFGQLSGGLMIAPATIVGETERALRRNGLTEYIDLWQARHLGFASTADIVSSAWDLAGIAEAYRTYLDQASRLAAAADTGAVDAAADADHGASERDVFVAYLSHINAWRELPFMDPGLPAAHLPADWPAVEARETFRRVADQLRPDAWRHFVQVLTARPTPA